MKCPYCQGKPCIRKGVRRGNLKYQCQVCGKWFQVRRGRKSNSGSLLLSHLYGLSFRSLANTHGINPSTAYRRCLKALEVLPHCADVTRKYCSRFCGILLVDGKYIAVKGYGRKIPVLYGVDYLTHDIPHYLFSVAENYQTCVTFFQSLRLANYPLQAVVCDDNVNIYQAATKVYPAAVTQLCQNHYKQSVRLDLDVRNDPAYLPFMREIEVLFEKRRSGEEFQRLAGKILFKHQHDPRCLSVLTDIQRRLPYLNAYTALPRVPRTTNLIESYNSHLQGRLKTIKGFESFKHADTWLNAYFLNRRLKPFTDCGRAFHHLNGRRSLELTKKPYYQLDPLLKLFR